MSLMKKVHDWFEVRLGIDEIAATQLTGYLLPRNINAWYSMGSILLVIFGLQVITGILLLFSYVPDADKAFGSITRIMNEVPFGWLLRTCHAAGSSMMVIVLFCHLLSVLFMGSYKSPRELNWLSGLTLFILVLATSLAGNLLPWSHLSFWATTLVTGSIGTIPYLGDFILEFIRGGKPVGPPTLRHFFALHVALLPTTFVCILAAHLFFLERIGISTPPFGLADTKNPWPRDKFRHADHPDGIPFYPHYLLRDLAAIFVYLAVFFAAVFIAPSLFLPPDAFVPADVAHPPAHIRPPWYILANCQFLKLFPGTFTGLMAQGTALTFLALLPFLDRGKEKHPLKRPLFLVCSVGGIMLYIALMIWGHYS
ncbi:MAG TPA: cytochrome bc complex cytochrome b subunit [Geobacteraceae bacterium]